MKTTYYQFNSLSQLAYTLDTMTINKRAAEHMKDCGLTNYKPEYIELLKRRIAFGDPEYAEKVKDLEREIKGIVGTKHTYQLRNSYVGQIPNVGRYCAGLPDCMYNLQRVTIKGGKVLTIVYYNAKVTGVSYEELVRINLTICKAIAKLEAQGYFLNLYIGNGCSTLGNGRSTTVFSLVRLKGSNEKIDLRKISYALLNPTFSLAHKYLCAGTEGFRMPRTFGSSYAWEEDGYHYRETKKRIPDCKAIFSHELKNKTEDEIIESLLK